MNRPPTASGALSDPVPHSTDPFTLVISQLRPRKGRVDENLARIRDEVESSAGRAGILALPETFLSGYFVEGGVEEVARTTSEIIAGLGVPPAAAPDLIFGAYERAHGAVHNSAFHFTPAGERWELVHRHRKTLLPTYGVFDEARFVTPGDSIHAFDTRFGRIGLLICEEMLHSLPPATLALDGADLIVALAASPARDFGREREIPGNLERWDIAGTAITLEHGCYLAVPQAVGSEGGKLFAGGSVLYGPGGSIDARGSLFTEDRLEMEVNPHRVHMQRLRSPLLADLRASLPGLGPGLFEAGRRRSTSTRPVDPPGGSAGPLKSSADRPKSTADQPDPTADQPDPTADRPDSTADRPESTPVRTPSTGVPRPGDSSRLALNLPLVEKALLSFLDDEVRIRRGFENVVVGVSGGVDSAVTLALAVRAFGADAVSAFLLPYATSSAESLEHGRLVVESLGVSSRTIPVSEGVDSYIRDEESDITPLRRGNLAARFRAMVLWDQSAKLNALTLGTGNKSERLLGYYTWHADDSPPINPLGDLFKTQVLALARHLELPEVVIAKPPSADLVEGVHDEDELGVEYAVADLVLLGLLEGYGPAELVDAGFSRTAVDRVLHRLGGTHWKRRLPTVAMISSTAIGEFFLRPVDY